MLVLIYLANTILIKVINSNSWLNYSIYYVYKDGFGFVLF